MTPGGVVATAGPARLVAALPQWLQVDFPGAKQINRFVVITYQKEGTAETAGK